MVENSTSESGAQGVDGAWVAATTIGFSFIAGVVTVMIVRRHRTLRAASPDLAALVIALVVPLHYHLTNHRRPPT